MFFRPKSNAFSDFDKDYLINNLSDIIIDLSNFIIIDSSLLRFLVDLNEIKISKGFCLVVVSPNNNLISNNESFVLVPSLNEAKSYIEMERIQRDLEF